MKEQKTKSTDLNQPKYYLSLNYTKTNCFFYQKIFFVSIFTNTYWVFSKICENKVSYVEKYFHNIYVPSGSNQISCCNKSNTK
jgi:hypothetical protein